MKKSLIILISLIFIFNSCGYIVLFYSYQKKIKREVKNQIFKNIDFKNAELIKAPLSLVKNGGANFQMIDEHEFRFNGKMYDIIKRFSKNDTVYFYCINDKDEENLIKNFLAFGDTGGKTNPLGELAIKKLKMFHFDWFSEFNKISFMDFIFAEFPGRIPDNYLSKTIEPETPPPLKIV